MTEQSKQREVAPELQKTLVEILVDGGVVDGAPEIVEQILPILQGIDQNAFRRGMEDQTHWQDDAVWMQERRIEALDAARATIAARTIGGSGQCDPKDLLPVANWVMTGEDPYAAKFINIGVPEGMTPKMTWVNGRGMVAVEDSQLPDPYPDEGRDGPDYDTSGGDEGR